MKNKNEILLKIVKTWKIKEKPEYRGFRCANCQKYIHKAYHYWLDNGRYKTPVHFCLNCQKKFELGKIEVKKPKIAVNRENFGRGFKKEFIEKCKAIAKKWDMKEKPVYRIFSCDNCRRNLYKGWHVWLNLNDFLMEMHFCKECGEKSGFKNDF